MSAEFEERLIQRAVDGELSNDQRRELFERCERNRDVWKTLACAFLEEQLVCRAVSDQKFISSDDASHDSPLRPAAQTALRWYQHPAVAVATTVCTAFVLGLIFPWDVGGHNSRLLADSREAPAAMSGNAAAGLASPDGIMSVRNFAGPGGISHESIVISADEMDSLMKRMNHLLNVIEWQRSLEPGFPSILPLTESPQRSTSLRFSAVTEEDNPPED